MKFICDDNLGKLARYLRILGFDTHFNESIEDIALLRIAASEDRHLITRDHKLSARIIPHGILILENDEPLNQLSRVIQQLKLKIDSELLFNRCSRCNGLCHTVDKRTISEKVFPFILKTQETIKQCPACRRFYWKGSHYKALLTTLKSAIPDENIQGEWPDIQ
ncbi:MAG: Mut7-C RNAse domain-containing protein [candidate division Zixibacteria bacterium]